MTELQELKRLLVGEETDAVRKLSSRLDRLEDREHRLQNVVESLPEAILASDDRLSQALGKPVRDSFRDSLARDPQQYAEILYPVMAPAIRMSIAQAMRDVVRTINQTVDSTFSAQSLKWRIDSIRTRTPYSQIVLQNSFEYRVEEILLIHKVTGLLIDRVVVDSKTSQDGDAVGAMLSALEDFVRDSFSHESDVDRNLHEVEVGGRTVWLSHSPNVTMATVILGHPPEALRSKLDGRLEALHAEYGPALREFDGRMPIPGVQNELMESLNSFPAVELGEVEEEVRRPDPLGGIIKVAIGVALLSSIIYFVFRSIEERTTLSAAHRILDDTPGMVVTDISRRDEKLHVTGLRDPLAEINETHLRGAGIDLEEVVLEMEPYQSLDGEIVVERAQKQLEIPDSIEVWLDDDVLKLRGEADYPWLQDAIERSRHVDGITAISFDGVIPRGSTVEDAVAVTSNAPDTVDVQYIAGVVKLEGNAPLSWIDDFKALDFTDKWIRRIDRSAVMPTELTEIQDVSRKLDAQRLFIQPASENSTASIEDSLLNISPAVIDLLENCEILSRKCLVNVYVTSAEADDEIEVETQRQVERVFREQGVPRQAIDVQSGGFYDIDPDKAHTVISFRADVDEN